MTSKPKQVLKKVGNKFALFHFNRIKKGDVIRFPGSDKRLYKAWTNPKPTLNGKCTIVFKYGWVVNI